MAKAKKNIQRSEIQLKNHSSMGLALIRVEKFVEKEAKCFSIFSDESLWYF